MGATFQLGTSRKSYRVPVVRLAAVRAAGYSRPHHPAAFRRHQPELVGLAGRLRWFGFVSLAADMVYEGARSVYGPSLASSAPPRQSSVSSRARARRWPSCCDSSSARSPTAPAATGPSPSSATASPPSVCALPAVTPFVGAAGLALASVLILLERSGKAVRSPSKSALLAHVATAVGRGRGFGVHKALDQVGALAGPLLVAAVIAAAAGAIWPAMLAIPGAVAMVLLAVIRSPRARPVGLRRDGHAHRSPCHVSRFTCTGTARLVRRRRRGPPPAGVLRLRLRRGPDHPAGS